MFELKLLSCQLSIDNRVVWDSLRYGRAFKTSSLAIFSRRGGWHRGTSPKFSSLPRSCPEMCELFAGASGGLPLLYGSPAQGRRLDHLSKNLGALFAAFFSEPRAVLFRNRAGSSLPRPRRFWPWQRGGCPRLRLAPRSRQHIFQICSRLYACTIYYSLKLFVQEMRIWVEISLLPGLSDFLRWCRPLRHPPRHPLDPCRR